MLDKNGLPLQFPPSAFSAFSGLHAAAGLDPRNPSGWPNHPAFSAAAAAAAAQNQTAGLPPTTVSSGSPAVGFAGNPHSESNLSGLGPHHPALSPNFLASPAGFSQQEYLNAAAQRLSEMQAASALDPLNALEASRRASRKRAISASPYSEMDLSTLIRYSPTALHLLNGGSPTSSGSYGHLSPGAISPALVHSAHLQQLQAHLIRSASTSPFLSPQNSLQATLLHSSAAAAAAVSAAAAFQTAPTTNPYFPFINPGCESKSSESALQGSCRGLDPVSAAAAASKQLETCSNVVSSTMEDEDSSSREGLTPLTTIKHEPGSTTGNCESTTASRSRLTGASTADAIIKDEPDFVETHCHWVGCDRDLHSQDQLVKHLNNDHIGNSKKAFVCLWKDCSREEKPFKAQYMLVVHMRRHTGEKPHRCTFENCTKAYSRLENLKTHLRSHTGEKPYTCEFPGCAKAFSNASDRAKHQNRTHSNEKPYACKAPGCTKRYTDPSSLRKHVKTVHGHEFYASKRHKGNNYDHHNQSRGPGSFDENNPNTPRTPHSVSTVKSEVESSPGPISPSEERHNLSSGSGNSSAGGSAHLLTTAQTANNMPLSDNNVSTTNMALSNTWDINAADAPEQDINMAVAAAIGVGTDDTTSNGPGSMPGSNNALSQRLSNKMKMMSNPHPAALGDINRSIEKMSIGTYTTGVSGGGGGGVAGNQHCGMPPQNSAQSGQTMSSNANRRGSNWTNSTEGYGSMRSEQSMMGSSSSRRCSDVSVAMSQGSNISTRAMVNSPWDHMSHDSSRRSSMVSNPGSGSNLGSGVATTEASNIGHHLNRLHRRAQQQVMQAGTPTPMMSDVTPGPTPTNAPMAPNMVAQMQPHVQGANGSIRRASDPCRTLDRTFGVDARHNRRGSYDQMNMGQQARVPLHGQRIRGASGDTYFHQHHMQPPMYQQQQHTMPTPHQNPPRMAATNGAATTGNGANPQQQFQQANQATSGVNTQFPASYSNQVPNNYQENQQWTNGGGGAGSNPATAAYSGQNFPGYPNPDFNQQWQQQNGNTWNPNNHARWNNNSSNNNATADNNQQQHQPPTTIQPPTPGVQKQNRPPCDSNYQRTFDYVQQCQNWTAQ